MELQEEDHDGDDDDRADERIEVEPEVPPPAKPSAAAATAAASAAAGAEGTKPPASTSPPPTKPWFQRSRKRKLSQAKLTLFSK